MVYDYVDEGETMRKQRGGFTLIEMMIVVAVIAVLAAVVVPSFFRESAKGRASSETTPMMAEIAAKLEQYKSDTGKYVNTTTLENGTPVVCPPSPSNTGYNAITECVQTGMAWFDLRVQPVHSVLKCSYEVQVGEAGDSYSGTPPTGITFTAPTTTGWWTILATCDADNSSTVNSSYFMSSVDLTVQKVNDGQ